jgi:hypothetical protein
MPKRVPGPEEKTTSKPRGWMGATGWALGLASIDDRICEALDRESARSNARTGEDGEANRATPAAEFSPHVQRSEAPHVSDAVDTEDAFDPSNPGTWPDGLRSFLKSNLPSTADVVEAYQAWREDLRQEAIATALVRASPRAAPVIATALAVAPSPADDKVLTLQQAVEERGVGAAQIKGAIKNGELPGEYRERDGGRGYRVRRGDLMAWHPVSGRRTKPIPPRAPKREPAADQPPELRALGLRFTKGDA